MRFQAVFSAYRNHHAEFSCDERFVMQDRNRHLGRIVINSAFTGYLWGQLTLYVGRLVDYRI